MHTHAINHAARGAAAMAANRSGLQMSTVRKRLPARDPALPVASGPSRPPYRLFPTLF